PRVHPEVVLLDRCPGLPADPPGVGVGAGEEGGVGGALAGGDHREVERGGAADGVGDLGAVVGHEDLLLPPPVGGGGWGWSEDLGTGGAFEEAEAVLLGAQGGGEGDPVAGGQVLADRLRG